MSVDPDSNPTGVKDIPIKGKRCAGCTFSGLI